MKSLIAFLIPLVCLSCVRGGGKEDLGNIIEVGHQVPRFHVDQQVVGGEYKDFTSPEDFEGRNTLLVFFTTRCPDCQRDIRYAGKVWRELGPEQVNVVCISRGFNSDYTPHKFWEDYSLGDMPWFVDPDGTQAFAKFATGYVPRFYLVDPTGTVIWMKVENLGYGEYDEAKGAKFVEEIKKQLNK